MKKYLFILLFGYVQPIFAQSAFIRIDSIPVTIAGKQLVNPWAGGLNFCQLSSVDLNNDGIKDLFVFDKTGNKISTFINAGIPDSSSYVYAPVYADSFPTLLTWAFLKDYNCDGKEDIFTKSLYGSGFAIYKNTSGPGGIKFELADRFVHAEYYPPPSPKFNLYVSPAETPAIIDMDNDGDLDILSFQFGNASLTYFQNQSAELYGGICDSIIYKSVSDCWGGFARSGSTNQAFLGSCKGGSSSSGGSAQGTRDLTSTLFGFDADHDGDNELIMGDGYFKKMIYLENGGDSITPDIISQDTAFPSYDLPIQLSALPACSYVDVNNDGVEDLLVSPFQTNNSENFNSILYYKNTGGTGPVTFSYQKNNFLQDNMIDVGEGAYPSFIDYNGDGLKDILIGNYGYFNSTINDNVSSLTLFKNIGTIDHPAFELVTRDYQGLSSLHLKSMFPSFGDLDNDGDQDMILGDYFGKLHYFENTALPGDTMKLVLAQPSLQNIDVGDFAAPQIVDVNGDGKLDLLIGNRSGYLQYYQGKGTTPIPSFDSVTVRFGNVSVRKGGTYTGYCIPFLFAVNGVYQLMAGSERGTIYLFNNINNNLGGTFNVVDSIYGGINMGIRASIGGADINNDGFLDLIVGSYAGGITIFKGDSLVNNIGIAENKNLPVEAEIYPNPASNALVVKINGGNQDKLMFSIYDALGQLVLKRMIPSATTSIDVSTLPPGVYFCSIKGKNQGTAVFSKKLVIIR